MAFTRVNPGDPIQAQQLNQVVGSLNGTAGAGQPVVLTALNDAINYALTVQNDEAGNSRALNVLKSDGTTLIKADASGVTLGPPLSLPTGSITSAMIADGTVGTVDLAAHAVTQSTSTAGSTNSPTTTSTVPVDMPDMSLFLFSVPAGADLLVFGMAAVQGSAVGTQVYVGAQLDGGVDALFGLASASVAGDVNTVAFVTRFTSVAAGTRNVKMRWWVNSGTGTAFQTARSMLMVQLAR